MSKFKGVEVYLRVRPPVAGHKVYHGFSTDADTNEAAFFFPKDETKGGEIANHAGDVSYRFPYSWILGIEST